MNFIYPNFAKYAGINLQLMFDSDSEFSDSNNECNKENTRNNNYLNNNENLCNKIFSCKIIKNINKNKLSISETTYNLNNDLDDFSLFNNCENLSISDGFKDSNNIENLSVSDEFRDLNEIENLSVFVFHENFLNCVNFNKLENLNNFDNYNKDFEIFDEFDIISDDFDSDNYEEFYTIVNCNFINKEKGCKNIPIQYLDLRKVFNEKNCDKLPPHKEYDCEIKLKDNSSLFYGPFYSLTELEREELKKYLEENLKKGFKRKSTSPAGAPILFVKKKDCSLRLCIDY
eukprot:jgi/Orpsp1_1/1174788/evm.model.c7180000051422.1